MGRFLTVIATPSVSEVKVSADSNGEVSFFNKVTQAWTPVARDDLAYDEIRRHLPDTIQQQLAAPGVHAALSVPSSPRSRTPRSRSASPPPPSQTSTESTRADSGRAPRRVGPPPRWVPGTKRGTRRFFDSTGKRIPKPEYGKCLVCPRTGGVVVDRAVADATRFPGARLHGDLITGSTFLRRPYFRCDRPTSASRRSD